MSRILVLGAGMMGAAITVPAADNGHGITLVGTPYDDPVIRSIADTGWHPGLETQLSERVHAVPFEAGKAAVEPPVDLVVAAVASGALSWACRWIAATSSLAVPVVIVAKGVSTELDGIVPLSDFAEATLRQHAQHTCPVVAVAGPCIARDLANKHHTSVVLASRDPAAAETARALLATDYYHLQTETDVDGAEFCAAFKNLYAIAVGWGAGTGARRTASPAEGATVNLKATLFAQALLEMGYLVEVFGGVDKTALGPAGAGDLYVTCEAGRNGRLGRYMGSGLSFSDAMAGPMRGVTVEGAELAHRVEPILRARVENGSLDGTRIPFLMAILHEICVGRQDNVGIGDILGVDNGWTGSADPHHRREING